jgi:hypothetical protein
MATPVSNCGASHGSLSGGSARSRSMKLSGVVATAVLVIVAASTFAASDTLTVGDIAQIQRACRGLVGRPAADVHILLGQFQPYLRSKDELGKHYWGCSSQHCTGTVLLRDGAALIYSFPNIPYDKDPLSLEPDIVVKGNNRVDFAGLVRRGNVIFTVPSKAKPNLWRFRLTNRSSQPLNRADNLHMVTSTTHGEADRGFPSGGSAHAR